MILIFTVGFKMAFSNSISFIHSTWQLKPKENSKLKKFGRLNSCSLNLWERKKKSECNNSTTPG